VDFVNVATLTGGTVTTGSTFNFIYDDNNTASVTVA
jgi:hypothetical protein